MAQPLRPTLKERKRYVVYTPADDTAVLAAHRKLFGIAGAARAGIRPVDDGSGLSILRVSHTSVDELKAALVWSGKTTKTVAGTLKKARAALS